jgi:hypothetical protein
MEKILEGWSSCQCFEALYIVARLIRVHPEVIALTYLILPKKVSQRNWMKRLVATRRGDIILQTDSGI